MKKLALIISSALLISTHAFATNNSETFHVKAQVENSCQMEVPQEGKMEFYVSPTADYTADIIFRCNNPNGATVTLTSLYGGLKHATRDDVTKVYNYTATLNVVGEEYLVLEADGTPELTVTKDITSMKSIENLSARVVPSHLTVKGVEDMASAVAGEYLDELSVSIVSL